MFFYIPPLAAAVEISLIGLAHNSDLFVFIFLCLIAGWSSGNHCQNSDEDELQKKNQNFNLR
jgi:hypothetical protein